MKAWIFVVIFLIIHIILCIITYALMKMRVLKLSEQVMPLVFGIPIWGFMMLVLGNHMTVRQTNGRRDIDLHQFTIDEKSYRKIAMTSDSSTDSVVPLEEAIIINNSATRREFMMDIISQNSRDYIDLLQKAKFNDDVEVAHYASTAIMEVQREFELKIQECRQLCEEEPENFLLVKNLADALKSYIDSGLIEESVLTIQRMQYGEALQKMMDMTKQNPDMNIYMDAIDNQIELSSENTALALINQALLKWPDKEEVWLLKIKFCHKTSRGRELKQTIEDLKKTKIFLSQRARNIVSFWSENKYYFNDEETEEENSVEEDTVEETFDNDTVDEETVEDETFDEEAFDEEAFDEEAFDEEAFDEETTEEEQV